MVTTKHKERMNKLKKDAVLANLIDFHNELQPVVQSKFKINRNLKPLVIPRGYKVMLGVEVEALATLPHSSITRFIKKNISKRCGYGATKWNVHSDGSIRRTANTKNIARSLYDDINDLDYLRYTLEVSTAVNVWDKTWSDLIKLVSYLNDTGSATNRSCGLHLNISVWKKVKGKYVNVTGQCKVAAIRTFLNRHESELGILWGRVNTYYAQSIKTQFNTPAIKSMDNISLRKSVNDCYRQYNRSRRRYGETMHPFRRVTSKYQTINFQHMETRNQYLECRIAGNSYCHLRLLDAYYTISLLADTIIKSVKGK